MVHPSKDIDLNYCLQENTIFVKPGVYALSNRKLQSLINIANAQKYYQCNPVRFISDFFNIELLDAQAWVIQRSWNCPNVLLVCTRGFGKSTIIDIMIMAKGMLFNNYWTYIASGSGSQAEQTFSVLEKLANGFPLKERAFCWLQEIPSEPPLGNSSLFGENEIE